jgi:phage tail sheath gpL-like
VPVGTGDPPWPTPAECYLAALAPVTKISIGASGHVAAVGPEDTAEIVAAVADSLIAVGALPVTVSTLWEAAWAEIELPR